MLENWDLFGSGATGGEISVCWRICIWERRQMYGFEFAPNQTRPYKKIHFCEVAISRMLTSTQILHSGILLILLHFYFPIYSISSFHLYKLSLGRIFTSAQFCQTWAVSSQSHLSLLLSLLSLSFFYYYLSLQSHLQETTYLPGFRCSGITTLLSEIIKLLMMMIRTRRRRKKGNSRRRIIMTTLSEIIPKVQSPLHQPSCLLSSRAGDFSWFLTLFNFFLSFWRHEPPGGWNWVGMCVALPPNQPMSISGQGVGKFEQSSLFMHLPGDHDDGGYQFKNLPACWGPLHCPTKAMPRLSSWILGIGFRAHVEPFGTT